MDVSLLHEAIQLKKILALFSNEDSLKIFLNAKDGLVASSITCIKMNIHPKTYYSKLKKLMDFGLIEKINGKYIHTTFGNIVYQKIFLLLLEHIPKIEQYKIVDTLKRSSKFSEGEIKRFLMTIDREYSPSDSLAITNKARELLDIDYNNKEDIKIFWAYDDVVYELLKSIENSTREILIATRTFNDKLFNALYHKAREGIKLKILCDNNLIKKYYQIYGKNLDTFDMHNQERITTIENPWYDCKDIVERRITNVPFGIMIVDSNKVYIEIINQYEESNFTCSIFTKDKNVLATMKNFYNSIWNTSLNPKQ
jgi:predicted transcriptional regulator